MENRVKRILFALNKPDPPGSTSGIAPDDYEIGTTEHGEPNAAITVAEPVTIKMSADGAEHKGCDPPSKMRT